MGEGLPTSHLNKGIINIKIIYDGIREKCGNMILRAFLKLYKPKKKSIKAKLSSKEIVRTQLK
jgi:hypothetical protein